MKVRPAPFAAATVLWFAIIGGLVAATTFRDDARAHKADRRHVTASYYSGAQGACGELDGNYAASKWFACGAKVRVTNRQTGATTTVRILDRCQCGLDVNPRSFNKIADTSDGLAPVCIEKKHHKRHRWTCRKYRR